MLNLAKQFAALVDLVQQGNRYINSNEMEAMVYATISFFIPEFRFLVFFLRIVIKQYVCYDLKTSNLDKVHSNNFIVPCVSGTSEFQGVFAKEFKFD